MTRWPCENHIAPEIPTDLWLTLSCTPLWYTKENQRNVPTLSELRSITRTVVSRLLQTSCFTKPQQKATFLRMKQMVPSAVQMTGTPILSHL